MTQNVTDPSLGPAGLALLREGTDARAVLKAALSATPQPEWRQMGVIDRDGATALHSGAKGLPIAAFAEGENCVSLGNLLVAPDVPARMVAAFTAASGLELAERLLLALEAGQAAGGEGGTERAAGLHVAERFDWPTVDLRVDWHDEPIAELRRLWTLYEPQKDAFIARAQNPSEAPAF